MNKYLLVLLGPTAVGKTDLSIELAKMFDTSILSADSRQIFREMSVGTAVPSQEQLSQVKHYFIHYKSVREYYNASMFEFEAIDLLDELFKTKNVVLMVGGSGLYIDAVCRGIDDVPTVDMDLRNHLMQKFNSEGIETLRLMLKQLDPIYYQQTDLRNPMRILKALEISLQTGKPYSTFLTNTSKTRIFKTIKIGLNRNREELYQRIDLRVDSMFHEGLLKEAEMLFPIYQETKTNTLNTVGYRELFDFFDKELTFDEAIYKIKINTRHYAKRQITWFNRDKEIGWFHPNESEQIKKHITESII